MGAITSARQLATFKMAQRRGFAVPDQPHFDPASMPIFMQLLGKARSYLEYGSGGSTIVATQMRVPTVTVESDRFFARAVTKQIAPGSPHIMLVADIGMTREWGVPVFKTPTPSRLKRWRTYVDMPFDTMKNDAIFPDLVLVDGRFRRACALESARQAQLRGVPTTIFVDDYQGRSYDPIEEYLGKPDMAGVAAIFRIGPHTTPVPVSAVDAAIHDYG